MSNGLSPAAAIQAARVSADLQNHKERVEWLQSPRPCWADGVAVDAHTRHAMLIQSQEALSRA